MTDIWEVTRCFVVGNVTTIGLAARTDQRFHARASRASQKFNAYMLAVAVLFAQVTPTLAFSLVSSAVDSEAGRQLATSCDACDSINGGSVCFRYSAGCDDGCESCPTGMVFTNPRALQSVVPGELVCDSDGVSYCDPPSPSLPPSPPPSLPSPPLPPSPSPPPSWPPCSCSNLAVTGAEYSSNGRQVSGIFNRINARSAGREIWENALGTYLFYHVFPSGSSAWELGPNYTVSDAWGSCTSTAQCPPSSGWSLWYNSAWQANLFTVECFTGPTPPPPPPPTPPFPCDRSWRYITCSCYLATPEGTVNQTNKVGEFEVFSKTQCTTDACSSFFGLHFTRGATATTTRQSSPGTNGHPTRGAHALPRGMPTFHPVFPAGPLSLTSSFCSDVAPRRMCRLSRTHQADALPLFTLGIPTDRPTSMQEMAAAYCPRLMAKRYSALWYHRLLHQRHQHLHCHLPLPLRLRLCPPPLGDLHHSTARRAIHWTQTTKAQIPLAQL